MSQAPDNVTPLKTSEEDETPVVETETKERKPMDLSKIALVVALLSIVLSVIFFFGVNRNLSGLSNEVKDIGAIRNNVEALDTYVDGLLEQMGRVNTRIMELEKQPRKEAVRVLQESMVNDMLRRTEFMESQLAEVAPDDEERAAKLAELQTLLQELQGGDQVEEQAVEEGAEATEAAAPAEEPAEAVLEPAAEEPEAVVAVPAEEIAPEQAEAVAEEAAPVVEETPVEQPVAEEQTVIEQPAEGVEPGASEGDTGQLGPNNPTKDAEATIEEAAQAINELFEETRIVPAPEGAQLVPAPEAVQPAQ